MKKVLYVLLPFELPTWLNLTREILSVLGLATELGMEVGFKRPRLARRILGEQMALLIKLPLANL